MAHFLLCEFKASHMLAGLGDPSDLKVKSRERKNLKGDHRRRAESGRVTEEQQRGQDGAYSSNKVRKS